MPSHKFAYPEGVLHARISDVHQEVTIQMIRQLFRHSGEGYVICAFDQFVDGMYGVEAYVEFRSRRRAARARDALDGHAVYDGCCFLAVDHLPLTYTTITMPDDDGMAPSYFYDNTPYAEWSAAFAVAEHHDEAPTSSTNDLQLEPSMGAISVTPLELASPKTSNPSTTTGDTVLELALSNKVLEVDSILVAAPTPTTCSTGCPSYDASEKSELTSSAAPPSSTTAGSIAPEPAAPEAIQMPLRWLFPILNLDNLAPTRCSTKVPVNIAFPVTSQFTQVSDSRVEPRPLPWPSFAIACIQACTLVQLEEVLNLAIASAGLPVQHSVGLLHDCYIQVWVSFLFAGQLIQCVFKLNQWEIAWIIY